MENDVKFRTPLATTMEALRMATLKGQFRTQMKNMKLLRQHKNQERSMFGPRDDVEIYANGGMVGRYNMGGLVKPKYFAKGGMVGHYAKGGDVVPSMLTPGEFVVSQPAVKKFGAGNLESINNGSYGGGSKNVNVSNNGTNSANSVYNSYSVNINVSGESANPEALAKVVLKEIKKVSSQGIRGV
jgi:hypothetical protein